MAGHGAFGKVAMPEMTLVTLREVTAVTFLLRSCGLKLLSL